MIKSCIWGKKSIEVMFCVLLSISCQGYVMLTCLILDDVDPDLLIKVVSVGFLHYEVTIFPLVINIVGRHLETRCNILGLLLPIGYRFLNIPKWFVGCLGIESK